MAKGRTGTIVKTKNTRSGTKTKSKTYDGKGGVLKQKIKRTPGNVKVRTKRIG